VDRPELHTASARAALIAGCACAAVSALFSAAVARQSGLRTDLAVGCFAGVVAGLLVERQRRALARVTERVVAQQRAERRLRDRELELLLGQMPAAVWTVDRGLRFTAVSGAALRRIGVDPARALGVSLPEYFGADDPAYVPIAAHRKALAGVPQDYDFNWSGRWFLNHLEPLREGDAIVGVIGIAQDVTERRRTERDKLALLEVAEDVAGSLELDEVMGRVGQRTAAVLPCDAVAVFREDRAQEARLMAAINLPDAVAARAGELPALVERARAAAALPADAPLVLNDIGERPPAPWCRGVVGALAATALTVRGRRVGLLVAANTGARRFHPPQVQLLDSIARQLALAIHAADLYAAQREEASVGSALARIGRAVISELDRPVLLERLARLTIDELACDASRTYLLDAEGGGFIAVASAGETAEQREALRVLHIPRAHVDPHIAALRERDVTELDAPAVTSAGIELDGAPAHILVMALRRGADLVGLHVARYVRRTGPCSALQVRIAGGLAQLASLALENARLVEELDRANRVKADFVASMSHELRTPLNVIIGYGDLLLEHVFGELSAEQHETVRRIGEQGRELLELVNTTLDMSRLEAGRVPLALDEVDLVALLAEIEVESQLVRRNPAVTVTWHVAPDVPPLWTDPIKLKVIVKNLLLNALKFTDEGAVMISAALRRDGIEIAVADSGIGIAPEMMSGIFEPFRQGDHGGIRRGGVGLGLHIVRRLLDALGGSITVESEPHVGSTFRIWVPIRPPATRTEGPRREAEVLSPSVGG
jgi:PAS domain S-box-containing protein